MGCNQLYPYIQEKVSQPLLQTGMLEIINALILEDQSSRLEHANE